jgi:hypothetical protein
MVASSTTVAEAGAQDDLLVLHQPAYSLVPLTEGLRQARRQVAQPAHKGLGGGRKQLGIEGSAPTEFPSSGLRQLLDLEVS